MYVGNADGLLEYDGETWRLISLPNHSAILSLEIDSLDQIFYGGPNDFGLVQSDSMGQLGFKSLLPLVDSADQSFGDIWSITSLGESVYFRSGSHLFRYQNEKLKTWRSGKSILYHFSGRWILLRP